MSVKPWTPEDWIVSGDTGLSSKTIWRVMVGVTVTPAWHEVSVPHDWSDFGRCYRLLILFPWRIRLGEVAAQFPEWAPIVRQWDELTRLYEAKEYKELNALLWRLIDESREPAKKTRPR